MVFSVKGIAFSNPATPASRPELINFGSGLFFARQEFQLCKNLMILAYFRCFLRKNGGFFAIFASMPMSWLGCFQTLFPSAITLHGGRKYPFFLQC